MKSKLMVIEDHPLMQMAIQTVLRSESDLELSPPIYDQAAILQQMRDDPPDLILLDLSLPGIDPIDLITRLRKINKEVRILIYSGSINHQLIASAMRENVNGFLSKNSSITELITAIRAVLNGQTYLSGIATTAVMRYLENSTSNQAVMLRSTLTARERDIFDRLIRRQSTQEIADDLEITSSGIRSHITHIMRKFGVNSLTDLLLYAKEHDLL